MPERLIVAYVLIAILGTALAAGLVYWRVLASAERKRLNGRRGS
jgi:hypothetical protein